MMMSKIQSIVTFETIIPIFPQSPSSVLDGTQANSWIMGLLTDLDLCATTRTDWHAVDGRLSHACSQLDLGLLFDAQGIKSMREIVK